MGHDKITRIFLKGFFRVIAVMFICILFTTEKGHAILQNDWLSLFLVFICVIVLGWE